jgi:predicted nucleic acid-binding Zn finger protein
LENGKLVSISLQNFTTKKFQEAKFKYFKIFVVLGKSIKYTINNSREEQYKNVVIITDVTNGGKILVPHIQFLEHPLIKRILNES